MEHFFSLTIRLGWTCNGRCVYCSVGKYLKTKPEDEPVSEDLYRYICEWSQSATKDNPKGIGFYGGEPLLYWNKIKEIRERLYSEPEFNKDCIRMRIITNGILLNDEIVDYCNENNILVTLSYDAPVIDGLRMVYMPESKVPLFNRLKCRQVQFVYNAVNCRPLQSKLFLEKKFPGADIRCSFYANYNDEPNPWLNGFRKSEMLAGLRELLAYYKGKEPDLVFQRVLGAVVRRLDKMQPDSDIFDGHIQCIAGSGIAIDLKGNIYACANCGDIATDIRTGRFKEQKQACNDYIASRLIDKCKECPYLSICRVYCPLAHVENGEYEYCNYHKILYNFVLANTEEIRKILANASYDISKGYGRYSMK